MHNNDLHNETVEKLKFDWAPQSQISHNEARHACSVGCWLKSINVSSIQVVNWMRLRDVTTGRTVKVNSVQEACTKCFAVQISKLEILLITWKKWNKEHQIFSFHFFTNNLISEPQSIWGKLLVLSWHYKNYFSKYHFCPSPPLGELCSALAGTGMETKCSWI